MRIQSINSFFINPEIVTDKFHLHVIKSNFSDSMFVNPCFSVISVDNSE
jgi:hypothetical protein